MNAQALEPDASDSADRDDWFVRFWPPMDGRGNPFLTLVDPSYTARILREQGSSLSPMAVLQVHEIADPPENG